MSERFPTRYPDRPLWSVRPSGSAGTPARSPLDFLEALARRGDFVRFTLGRRSAVLLNRPDYVSAVLVADAVKFEKGSANERAKHLLGNGLLTADATLHAERRKVIQPAFARGRLDACAGSIVSRARAMCERWRADEVVDVADEIGRLTFGVVGDAIVGHPVDSEYRQVKEAVSEATASIDPLLSLVAPLRRVRPAQARLRLVVERLASRASGQADQGSLLALLDPRTGGTGQESGGTGLQPCREDIGGAGLQPCHPDQPLDDLLTILLAGYDTITSALTWTLALLSAHPDAERQMRGELRAVLGERDATAADVARLSYTRAVFAEALRLYPPAWALARRAVEPHRFDEGEVAPGTIVLVSQYLLHRDERCFERPRSFHPDRWVGPDVSRHPRLAYFPFGAGSRACIGEAFGWMEGVLLLATIGRRWRLRLAGAFPAIDVRITMRPVGPVSMQVERAL